MIWIILFLVNISFSVCSVSRATGMKTASTFSRIHRQWHWALGEFWHTICELKTQIGQQLAVEALTDVAN